MKLLLSNAEYQESLRRAQENPGDLDPQKLREVTGDPKPSTNQSEIN